ncbi:MAG: phosphoenolpyruvate synthase [Deltaproteobacteria bacterium]|nr:phosphoenolpyruvate synthase [Deltaproteobacteria bacterium]
MSARDDQKFIYWFSELGIKDVPMVGGKNASLGEMFANLTGKGVRVPDGYAISAHAYNHYIESSGVRAKIEETLRGLNVSDVKDLARRGESVRNLIRSAPLPADLEQAIKDSYDELSKRYGVEVDVAVRSSATAEDLPDASFAGQQDTYLNIRGHEALAKACRNCFASLFTDRAIAYREEKDFDHFSVALSIAVQKMVRSDMASAGVMFSIDTESGFSDAIYITGGYGLGENVVQGAINPDEWYVHKPTLEAGFKPVIYQHLGEKQQKMIYSNPGQGKAVENIPVPPEEAAKFCLDEGEVLELARWADIIEKHYSEEAGYFKPMDMEWAKDGQTGELFIVQARPETVVSRREAGVIKRTVLEKTGPVLAEGMAVGDLVGTGKAAVIRSAENISQFKEGMVLVTEMTDPDWVPIMKIASAIVTDHGGRTCHAAIISRELGIPCIVGTGNGSKNVSDGQEITVSCAGGSKGVIYSGILPFKEETIRLEELTMPAMPMFYHQSDPDRAFPDSRYPHAGVGLVRVDEVIRDEVKVHPLACINYPSTDQEKVDKVSAGYPDKKEYFVTRLSQGVGRIAAAAHPKPVRVLLSDATSKEMTRLIGGSEHPHNDANPLLGTRGAGRYLDFDYEEAFGLELKALVRVRETMGLKNVSLVLPAAQSVKELKSVTALLEQEGLVRGQEGLELHLLCRTPAQMMALDSFADMVDGFVVHVSELAQLTLGIDMSNVLMKEHYDEKHPAVLSLIETGVDLAAKTGKPLGLAGISPANLQAFGKSDVARKAGYFVMKPDVFPSGREALLEAEGKSIH